MRASCIVNTATHFAASQGHQHTGEAGGSGEGQAAKLGRLKAVWALHWRRHWRCLQTPAPEGSLNAVSPWLSWPPALVHYFFRF